MFDIWGSEREWVWEYRREVRVYGLEVGESGYVVVRDGECFILIVYIFLWKRK